MKIVCVEGDSFFIKPDTAILRDGEPFFAPNFATADGVAKSSGVAVRITRMVKCIEAKFAYRTWAQFSHCVDYQLIGYSDVIVARSFDLSFAVPAQWHDKEQMSEQMCKKFDDAITRLTEFFTLRVGDYVFIADDK